MIKHSLRGARTLPAAALWLVVAAASTVGAQQAEIPPAPSPTTAEQRAESWLKHEQMRQASPFRNLQWRGIGPRFQGGRVEALAVDPRGSATMYVGAGAGNLWKTVNAGTTWVPVFERQSSFAIGDVALAPSAPDVVWVGTGEVLMARSSYAGSGVFRSGDGGATWEHKGLADTHHIAQIVVHPKDPDTVWVAAIGHLFSFNEERGVFKTTDGGDNWERVLYVDEATGAIDLVLDPDAPDTLYAAMWRHSRRAWGHTAAGATSGIYKSTDGGDSWAHLDGFPGGELIGRIGLAIAPSQSNIVYALVDNHAPREPDDDGRRPPRGEVYRSEDAGGTWRKVSQQNIPAGYDFCIIAVSPDDPDRVHVPGQVFWVSNDGGATFREENGTIVHLLDHAATVLHLDAHEFWIDPDDSDHQIVGNDGGVYVTYDDGSSWLHLNNLPLAEFYAINVDMEQPFNVYGGTQDDAAVFGPSNVSSADGAEDAWQHVYIDPWGGGDSYFTPPHPVDTHVVFYEHQFGDLRRKNLREGTTDDIRPRVESIEWQEEGGGEAEGEEEAEEGEPGDDEPAAPDIELRNNWMTPLSISHFDPDTLYYGTQYVLRSRDRGDTWEAISPDLTTSPGPERQGNVPYGTLTMVAESPSRSGTIWTGSDDGLVHVTTDNGAVWTDVTAGLSGAGAPTDFWVSRVTASAFDADRAYVAYTGYREDDFGAFLYVTDDAGKTWRSIGSGLPAEPVNAIAEDPERDGLLYVGTDYGVYVSSDAGDTWQSLVADLPTTTVHDLIVHPRDGELVIGTHGRSAFVLDVKPIRAMTADVAAAPLHLFEVAPAVRAPGRAPAPYRYGTTAGEAIVTYALKTQGEVTLSVIDGAGEIVRTITGPGETGVNVLHWDLAPDGAEYPEGSFDRPVRRVEAGTYRLLLTAGAASVEARLVVLDP